MIRKKHLANKRDMAAQALAPRPAFLIGYANGWPGYIPTEATYEEGGYSVDVFGSDPPALSRTALPRGAGEHILENLIDMANRL